MICFAVNSILNRLALIDGVIGSGEFAAIRIATGAIILFLLVFMRDRSIPIPARPNFVAIISLSAYMLGFSYAYTIMDAGIGALILFGGVQMTMFLMALFYKNSVQWQQWVGMIIALIGMIILTYPTDTISISIKAILLMLFAAIGWGVYSVRGKAVIDPTKTTAWNFIYGAMLVIIIVILTSERGFITNQGIILAMISGGLTSGLGYALWYYIMPELGIIKAALAQLCVPVIAIILGALFLNEEISLVVIISGLFIFVGIGIGILSKTSNKGH